jgi:hypothetical protein
MEVTVTTYWLLTEPARGNSFRVPVEPGQLPEEALESSDLLAGEFREWRDAIDRGDVTEDGCSFRDWLCTLYSAVQLVQE